MLQPPPPTRNPISQNNGTVGSHWLDFFTSLQQQGAPATAPFFIAEADPDLPGGINLGLLSTGYAVLTITLGIATFSTVPFIPQSDLRWSTVTKTFADTGFVSSAGQLVLTNATGGATTINLPAAPSDGHSVIVKKTDASGNAVNIGGNGHNIDGGSPHALAAQWNSAICVFSTAFGGWAIAGQV